VEDRRNNRRLATFTCTLQIWWLSPFTLAAPLPDLEEGLWLSPREGMVEGFALGNYLLLVELHRPALPRRQGADLGGADRDLGAAGQQRRDLASVVAEAGRRAVAGSALRGHARAVAGSGSEPGRASPDQPGRVRRTLRLGGTAKAFQGSISLGFTLEPIAVSAFRKSRFGNVAQASWLSPLNRTQAPLISPQLPEMADEANGAMHVASCCHLRHSHPVAAPVPRTLEYGNARGASVLLAVPAALVGRSDWTSAKPFFPKLDSLPDSFVDICPSILLGPSMIDQDMCAF
jgi:hypothetical protein